MKLEIPGMQGKTVRVRQGGRSIMIAQEGGFLTAERIKELPIRAIQTVEVKKPGLLCGFIQFNMQYQKDVNTANDRLEGLRIARDDENAVLFRGERNYRIAMRIRSFVSEQLAAPQGSSSSSAPGSPAEEIARLYQLYQGGTLSHAEYQRMKERIVNHGQSV